MKTLNEMRIRLESRSVNESFARVAVGAFCSQSDPTVEEINDIKTAVSEAVTNCIVHAYRNSVGYIYISVKLLEDSSAVIKIRDRGCGIENINEAMTPLFTTLGGERSGLGFSVMETFCDSVRVRSSKGRGTTVTLIKKIRGKNSY
ncbi:MAG: anti-sigma F factor [Ruminococcaceae bacterium]|nr:anti-sigma F factor [Oscillospiraceae bacterium]